MAYVFYYDNQNAEYLNADFDSMPAQDEQMENYNWEQEFRVCMVPSTLQISWYLFVMVCFSFCCRLVWMWSQHIWPRWDMLPHLASFCCGVILLLTISGLQMLPLLVLTLATYGLLCALDHLQLNSRDVGLVTAAICICAHILFEMGINNPSLVQAVRSFMMVASMKVISIGFDLDTISLRVEPNARRVPQFLPYLGYMLCPSTVMLGPWVSYGMYIQSIRPLTSFRWRSRFGVWCLVCSAIAIIFLNLSNCVVPMLYSDQVFVWLRAYRDALSVRCNHYFSCFLSQAAIAANGLQLHKNKRPNNWMGHMVSRPWRIEFPRSLSAVARSWNVPMHDWLKTYIYRGVRQRSNSYALAVGVTYLLSALMHGFYLKIYLVLLSLGCFGYVEYVLREKLASAFDFCISANSCRVQCRYKHCPSHGRCSEGAWTVMIINFVFSVIDMAFLAYLGIMLSDAMVQAGGQEDFDAMSGIRRWQELSFVGHGFAVFLYLLYFVM